MFYGPRPNYQLLLNQGFLTNHNPNDMILIAFKTMPSHDKFYKEKCEILQKILPGWKTYSIIFLCESSSCPFSFSLFWIELVQRDCDYFLSICRDETDIQWPLFVDQISLNPKLLAFLRVLFLSSETEVAKVHFSITNHIQTKFIAKERMKFVY